VGPTLVAMATTFALGTESNRLPTCLSVCLSVNTITPEPLEILSTFKVEKAGNFENSYIRVCGRRWWFNVSDVTSYSILSSSRPIVVSVEYTPLEWRDRLIHIAV